MGLPAEHMENFQRVFSASEGKLYAQHLQQEYDKTVVAMLYAPQDEVEVLRGKARALYEQLKFIHECVLFRK
jgi:hypothetical protein